MDKPQLNKYSSKLDGKQICFDSKDKVSCRLMSNNLWAGRNVCHKLIDTLLCFNVLLTR